MLPTFLHLILKELDKCPDTRHTEAHEGVANIHQIIGSAELLAELRLVNKLQLLANSLVRMAQDLGAHPIKMTASDHLRQRTGAERHVLHTSLGQHLDGRGDESLDGSVGRAGEVEGELDLVSVRGRETGKDAHGGNLAVLVLGPEVATVFHVDPRADVRDVHLPLALAVVLPVLDALVALFADVLGYLLADGDLVDGDTSLFGLTLLLGDLLG